MGRFNDYSDMENVLGFTNTTGFFLGLSILFSGAANRVTPPIVNSEPKVGRNDPCRCGRGEKHKNCCGRNR